MSDYYTKLKSKNDILSVAYKLGFSGKSSGRCTQGECPKHGSSGRKCLTIWPGIQGWKCYHCGESGDVINLVMHYKKMSLVEAVNYLADQAGMPHLNGNGMTEEERKKLESEQKEKALVYGMLTTAAEWYHKQLEKHPDIKEHLYNHYGFSEDIIAELRIGFAPPTEKKQSALADHLNSISKYKGHITKTGLFNFKNPAGPFWDFFNGRIIFPFWKNGMAVNLIGRATDKTPENQYECYTMKEED